MSSNLILSMGCMLATISVLGGCIPAAAPATATPAPTITPSPAPTITPLPTASPTPAFLTGQHAYTANIPLDPPVQIRYLMYLPASYGHDPAKKWPLILYLHGRGERGDDIELIKTHPLPKLLEEQTDFPFIVVSPQRSLDSEWWSDMIDPLNLVLDQIQSEYAVDPQRIYLTGISMGAFGAWEYALRYPKRFAAIVPIAGGWIYGSHDLPTNLCALKGIPIWVFWGEMDQDVEPWQSQILADALKACNGNVRITAYDDADHTATFYRAYADPQLYQWLSEQSLDGED